MVSNESLIVAIDETMEAKEHIAEVDQIKQAFVEILSNGIKKPF